MRATILLAMVLALAGCSQTGGGGGGGYAADFEAGDGDYYHGIVAPR
ncbi:hypothetical protein IB270_30590 [Ensifer sp. ENS05]|nr:hypothetical protein [Ensifer sp. ENS05]MBD9597184.1 hypothetical protein [Ensifer sp. ENS05]